MLVITRRKAEDLYIRDNKGRLLAVIRNLGYVRNQVRLGIVALDTINVGRGKNYHKPEEQEQNLHNEIKLED